ncbi:hypothetical protein LBMAG49_27830 [Planctomycetota bacterium]|nr:hypothetical protein LBMAG49_27830 [Planctomycetota bacterium]
MTMDLGFESIGNACFIAHDRTPVLACDPWLTGAAYFGSWRLLHEVPQQQIEHIKQCKFVWISHGHPDHLSLPSLELLRDKQILLADHYGGRIARDLRGLGYSVTVMKCGVWIELSPRLRIAAIANFNQDAVLLIELDGNLLIDANDAGDRGASRFFRREMARFTKRTFIACLTGYGDADMIHFFDEQGQQVLPNAAKKERVGPKIAGLLSHYGIQHFVPSSSNHCYRRTDSAWANEYATPVTAHADGFVSDRHVCLPPYVSFDLITGRYFGLEPKSMSPALDLPIVFGDDWSTPLDRDDVAKLRAYFDKVTHLSTFLGHINFRVGGKDHVLDINRAHARGITFCTPQKSLMSAIEWHAFDDLLIGNFTRTTLHGDWWGKHGSEALYPNFTPFVGKFGDNGGAYSAAELRAYIAEYERRGFTDFTLEAADREVYAALQQYL